MDFPSLSVAGTKVIASDSPVRDLGAMFDSSLSVTAQVNNMVKMANVHLENIGRTRQHLTEQTTKQLVQSLVISRLDYCNNLLCAVTSELFYHLQVVQNKAASLITRTKCHEHITPVLYLLMPRLMSRQQSWCTGHYTTRRQVTCVVYLYYTFHRWR